MEETVPEKQSWWKRQKAKRQHAAQQVGERLVTQLLDDWKTAETVSGPEQESAHLRAVTELLRHAPISILKPHTWSLLFLRHLGRLLERPSSEDLQKGAALSTELLAKIPFSRSDRRRLAIGLQRELALKFYVERQQSQAKVPLLRGKYFLPLLILLACALSFCTTRALELVPQQLTSAWAFLIPVYSLAYGLLMLHNLVEIGSPCPSSKAYLGKVRAIAAWLGGIWLAIWLMGESVALADPYPAAAGLGILAAFVVVGILLAKALVFVPLDLKIDRWAREQAWKGIAFVAAAHLSVRVLAPPAHDQVASLMKEFGELRAAVRVGFKAPVIGELTQWRHRAWIERSSNRLGQYVDCLARNAVEGQPLERSQLAAKLRQIATEAACGDVLVCVPAGFTESPENEWSPMQIVKVVFTATLPALIVGVLAWSRVPIDYQFVKYGWLIAGGWMLVKILSVVDPSLPETLSKAKELLSSRIGM